jgi:carotenoid cleavage dioxygenase-like enzyme
MKSFPELAIYTGFNAPTRIEADVSDLEIEGTVPDDIDGVFYRAGPDPRYAPKLGNDIYFNGDGLISKFTFRKGRVNLKTRYVRTDKFKAEEKAGRAMFGAYRNPFFDDPSVKGLSRGTANTNIVWHGGKLLALKEDSHPVEMDPTTLETVGNWNFKGKLKAEAFTAHPKLDPQTGEMIGFAYGAKGIDTPDVAYYVIDKKGDIVHEVWFQVPYANLMHDFAVTRDYVIFPCIPVCSSIERARQGLPTFMWDGSKDVFIGVLPRRGEARDLRWFRGPNRFASHIMNAFNEGTKIYVDTPESKSNQFPFFPDVTGAPFDAIGAQGRMTRWTFDMSSNEDSFTSTRLANLVGEFPRIDDRYAMEPYRHGWQVVVDRNYPFSQKVAAGASGLPINCIGHIDHATGAQTVYYCGPDSTMQEPQFIPKSANAPEGEGYIIVVCNRYNTMMSDLLVLDAQHLSEGPIATIHLPLRLRFALHGNWVPANQLPA